jgi:hypothetical protein
MPWIKLDDQWMNHPKIIKAGRDARDMWLASLSWCAQYLTDGYFPAELLPTLAVMAIVDVANCQEFAKRLLEVGLWERTENGYHIHDYNDYNPTKEQAEATKKARSEAGRVGGIAKASKTPGKSQANDKQNSAPSPSPSIKESEGANAPTVDGSKDRKPARKPIEINNPVWNALHPNTPIIPPGPKRIDTSWLPADIVDLGEAFMSTSNLEPPRDPSTRGYWISELRAMRMDDDITQDDIRRGVRKMRDTGGLIKSPASIRTAAIDVRAANTQDNAAEVW